MVLLSPQHTVGMYRNVLIAASVVIFHVAVLWAMQSGLMRRAVELVVPAEVLVEFIEPTAPTASPLQTQPPPTSKPVARQPAFTQPTFTQQPAPAAAQSPMPLATADTMPTTDAPTGVVAPANPAPRATAPSAAPQTASQPVAAPQAVARLELPSSNADYLQNPKPAYPPLSKRLGEEGKVVVRVFIAADGTAQQAEIKQSSGFERLDQAALTTVLRWRYVPGKRAGVAEGMWFNVPISFVLE